MILPLFTATDFRERAISPLRELGAYEALWLENGASFRTISAQFSSNPEAIPSDFVSQQIALEHGHRAAKAIRSAGIERFGVRVHGAGEYPDKLRDAQYPVELLYYSGWWELVETPCISIVGTRNPSEDGLARTRRLTKSLVEDGFTIVSGLAKGVDSTAHETAINAGGKTIAVIGTPLTSVYPSENAELQKKIARDFLLISQVPVLRYMQSASLNPVSNRFFFPERNITMSALTLGTVIVEAGETSGTIHQAKAALKQKRKLFILDNLFKRTDLTWPKKFQELGAIRISDPHEITKYLAL